MPERRMLSILFSSKENGTGETLKHLGTVQNYIMKRYEIGERKILRTSVPIL